MNATPLSEETVQRKQRRSAEEIARLLEEYRQSGLSQAAFCRQGQIALSTFTLWLHPRRRQSPARPVLREVNLAQVFGSCSWAAEITLPDGTIVRLNGNIAPALAGELLQKARA
jgi:hypothetical protein